MKHIYSLIFIICISLFNPIFAQHSNIRINLGASDYYHTKEENSLLKYEYTKYSVSPSIGYYHTIKNNWGIGIEVGKTFLDSTYNNLRRYNNVLEPYNHSNTAFKNYFISLGVFKDFNYKKYKLNILLLTFFEHIYHKRELYTSFSYTPEKHTHNRIYTYPKSYQLGVQLRPTLYRVLTKNLLIGIGTNFGIYNEYLSGSYINFVENISENTYNSETLTTKTKSNYRISFNKIGCQISINYSLNK